jgi:hypothetical protein
VYDFQPIAVGELDLIPLVARYDGAVQLDGDTIGLHSKAFNQSAQRERTLKIAIVAIDHQFHVWLIFARGERFLQVRF